MHLLGDTFHLQNLGSFSHLVLYMLSPYWCQGSQGRGEAASPFLPFLLQLFPPGLLFVITVTKAMTQSNWGGRGLFQRLTGHHKGRSGRSSRQELTQRSAGCAAYWLTPQDRLPKGSPPIMGWAGPSHVKHQCRKCPTRQSDEGIFSACGAFSWLRFSSLVSWL